MILRNATIQYKGYDLNYLSQGSGKRVCKTCDNCGRVSYIKFKNYKPLCRSCTQLKYGNLINNVCERCGKKFKIIPSKVNQKFCSNKCKDRYHSINTKGKNNPNWRGGQKYSTARAHAKRKKLGFKPLNDHFKGSEGHHITKDLVIFIPKDLHRSIYHRQDTYQGMNEINKLALKYLLGNY